MGVNVLFNSPSFQSLPLPPSLSPPSLPSSLPLSLSISLRTCTFVGLVSFLALFLNKEDEEGLPEEEAPP